MYKKICLLILGMMAFSFADECFFLSAMKNIETRSQLRKISCSMANKALEDMNYYASAIGREGWVIIDASGTLIMSKFFDSYYTTTRNHSYHYYLSAMMMGGNPVKCMVTTSSGPNCGAFEYVMLGMAVRDYYLNK